MSKIYLAGKHSRDVIIGDLLEKFSRKVEVYPPGTCPLTVQLSLLHASMNQTCGKCVPCRDGLPQLAKLLEQILNGVGTMEMLDEMWDVYFSHIDRERFRPGIEPRLVLDQLIYLIDGYIHQQMMRSKRVNMDALMAEYALWRDMLRQYAYKEEYQ